MIRTHGARLQEAPVDIVVVSALWRDRRGVSTLLRRAIVEAGAVLSATGAELAVVLTDDASIRELNRKWRGKDAPTNVLAFPAAQPYSGSGTHHLIGDIVIAYETLAREAAAEHKSFDDHLAHLAVHGFLHLCGHDHETEEAAAAMEGLEIAILGRLGIPNPYIARGHGA